MFLSNLLCMRRAAVWNMSMSLPRCSEAFLLNPLTFGQKINGLIKDACKLLNQAMMNIGRTCVTLLLTTMFWRRMSVHGYCYFI